MKDEERGFEVPKHVSGEIAPNPSETPSTDSLITRLVTWGEQLPEEDMEDLKNWAEKDIIGAIDKWKEHAGQFPFPEGFNIPADLSALRFYNPNLDVSLGKLCTAKYVLTKFGETEGKTPAGQNIGDTMHFVLIPWGLFTEELKDLGEAKPHVPELFYRLAKLRSFQNTEIARSFVDMDMEIIRNLKAQTANYLFGNDEESTASTSEYLATKHSDDGDWGIALMQTSTHSGLIGSVPKDDPGEGVGRDKISGTHKIIGFPVNKMGVFEALALFLQERELNIGNDFWLSANKMDPIPTDDDYLSDDMKTVGPKIERLFSGATDKRQVRLVIPG